MIHLEKSTNGAGAHLAEPSHHNKRRSRLSGRVTITVAGTAVMTTGKMWMMMLMVMMMMMMRMMMT